MRYEYIQAAAAALALRSAAVASAGSLAVASVSGVRFDLEALSGELKRAQVSGIADLCLLLCSTTSLSRFMFEVPFHFFLRIQPQASWSSDLHLAQVQVGRLAGVEARLWSTAEENRKLFEQVRAFFPPLYECLMISCLFVLFTSSLTCTCPVFTLCSQLQELKGNIRVVVRVKPCLPGSLPAIEVPAPAPSASGPGAGGELYAIHPTQRSLKPFAFDVVLGPIASQVFV